MNQEDTPALIIEYLDPLEQFHGWLVLDDLNFPMAAGGMRVQKGLTQSHLIKMACNMTMKMRIIGLPIGGAKCGIDYDPTAPGKLDAMCRFMAAIKPCIEQNYSMGPDLNTSMAELEEIAARLDIPSVKMAIAQAQGMNLPDFLKRYEVLNQEALPGWSLGRIRAGYGVGGAALAVLDDLKIPYPRATAAVQGFGTLARATIATLLSAGVKIRAVADVHRCLRAAEGFDLNIPVLLDHPGTTLPPDFSGPGISSLPRTAIYDTPCDIMIPAAIENTITSANAFNIQAKAVVPGANLAVTEEAAAILFQRRIPCLPSFLAGCGGSLSMNGLFAPDKTPGAAAVLAYMNETMGRIVRETISIGRRLNISLSAAACKYCEHIKRSGKPYQLELKQDANSSL